MQYILFVHPANTKSSHPHSICQANTNINTKNTNTMQCILFVTPILRPLTSYLRSTVLAQGHFPNSWEPKYSILDSQKLDLPAVFVFVFRSSEQEPFRSNMSACLWTTTSQETLWASTSWPSSQARVTSVNSLSKLTKWSWQAPAHPSKTFWKETNTLILWYKWERSPMTGRSQRCWPIRQGGPVSCAQKHRTKRDIRKWCWRKEVSELLSCSN